MELAEAVNARHRRVDQLTLTAFSTLDAETIEALRTEMKGRLGSRCQSIYVLTLNDHASAKQMRIAMAKARSEALEGRAYPRMNAVSSDAGLPTLYVGSSANTVSRMYQHLGSGPKATYALHLSAWARPLPGGIDIDVFAYPGLETTVLLALEDQLSTDLKPALGRRGAR